MLEHDALRRPANAHASSIAELLCTWMGKNEDVMTDLMMTAWSRNKPTAQTCRTNGVSVDVQFGPVLDVRIKM